MQYNTVVYSEKTLCLGPYRSLKINKNRQINHKEKVGQTLQKNISAMGLYISIFLLISSYSHAIALLQCSTCQ